MGLRNLMIGFYLMNRILKEPFDIVYTIGENYWQGKTTLQLMIKDIRFDDPLV